jgi:hypothetical protein
VGNDATLGVLLLSAVGRPALEALQWWLRLRFLRHVYDRGGPADLRVAGTVLRSIDAQPCPPAKARNDPPVADSAARPRSGRRLR